MCDTDQLEILLGAMTTTSGCMLSASTFYMKNSGHIVDQILIAALVL